VVSLITLERFQRGQWPRENFGFSLKKKIFF
jgi:hypothetical protein